MAMLQDNNALLLFRVGPVLCCAPTQPIVAIIEPPALTHPPGSSAAKPGIFRHANAIVASLDLRYKFGVEPVPDKTGRIIITTLETGQVGFHVDDIIEVIQMPGHGWGPLPALLPRGVFSRTLLLNDKIHLYAEFSQLFTISGSGYLRQYIQHLQAADATPHTGSGKSVTPIFATGSTPDPAPAATPRASRETPPRRANIDPPPASPQRHTSPPRPAATAGVTRSNESVKATSSSPRKHTHTPVPRQSVVTPLASGMGNPPRTTPATTASIRAQVTTPAQRAPAARTNPTASIKQDQAAPAHTPDAASRATATAKANQNSGIGLMLGTLGLLLVCFAGIGAGVWYLLRDPQPASEALAKQPMRPVVPTHARSISAETQPIVVATQQDERAPATSVTAEPSDEPVAQPPAGRDPMEAENTLRPAAPPVPSASPAISSAEYRASIERDPQGIIITLEAPADDPVFHQAQTDTAAHSNTAAGSEQAQESPTHMAQTTAPPAIAEPAVDSVEIVHIVVRGDTLWHIARRYVNNPYRYPELARLSNIRNPDLIYPGDRVRIRKRKKNT